MTLPKHLTKRGNVFYGRVAVPKSLRALREAAQATKNPNEITRSLGTSDRKMADQLLPEFLVAARREFVSEERALRAAGNSELIQPTASDLADIRRDFFLDGVRDDERTRSARKSFAEVEAMRQQLEARLASAKPMTDLERLVSPGVLEYLVASDAAQWSTESRAYLAAELRKHLTESNYVLVSDVLGGMAYAKGLDIKPNSLTYKALARGLLQEWLKVLKVADRRDQGIPDDVTPVTAMDASAGREDAEDGGGIVDLQGERARGSARARRSGPILKPTCGRERRSSNPVTSKVYERHCVSSSNVTVTSLSPNTAGLT